MKAGAAFGETLRSERERRGIPLEAVAAATKISPLMLAGLERGDCSRWPGGIYSRAYIREYAKAIGLVPEEVAARFAANFSDAAQPGATPAADPGRHGAGPGELRLTLAADSAGGAGNLLLHARLLAMEAVLVLASAGALATVLHADFWMAAAGAGLVCRAIGSVRSDVSASILGVALRGSGVQHLRPERARADRTRHGWGAARSSSPAR